MVVFSMNSKRPRRPNVRLWEIGDLSAAFACGKSQRSKGSLGQKKWINDPYIGEESKYLQVSEPEYNVSAPGIPSMILDDVLQNRENKDPNSLKPAFQFSCSDKMNAVQSKLDFGTITRKSRLMNRRRRSPNDTRSLYFGSWYSDAGVDMYNANDFKDCSDHETTSMNKEACELEIDDPDSSMEMLQKPSEFHSEGTCYEFPQSTPGCNNVVPHDSYVNSVREWLEELGFGKFTQLFKMHEVDEETLPFLTFEDLKEMGILAVGPRRKLFTAIQQLRGGQ